MPLTVTLELPPDVEQKLRRLTPDLGADVKETYAVELFRRAVLTHAELALILGLDRVETDALLKRHNVAEQSLTADDLVSDRETLERVLGTPSRAGAVRVPG